MATSGVSGLLGSNTVQSDTSSTTTSASAKAFDMNSFLTMFMTQLKYQDPTNPAQSSELASQLAQFSSVEKLTDVASTLKNIQSYSAATNNAEMASLVGKNVTGQMSTVDVKTDSVSTLDYQLDSATSGVTVAIKDSTGNTVYTESRGNQAAGSYKISWDGKDSTGAKVSAGAYTVEVQGGDSDGNTQTITTTKTGLASSLVLDDANPYYILSDGTKLNAAGVVGVATASTTSSASTTGTTSSTSSTGSTTTSTSATDTTAASDASTDASSVSSAINSVTSKLSSLSSLSSLLGVI